jgi:GTP-binding protein HflX
MNGDKAAVRGFVVAVDLRRPDRPLAPELAEFEALIEADAGIVVDRVVQRLDHVDPATLIGSGKAREIADRIAAMPEAERPTMIFVFNDLRPRQRTNLMKIIPLPLVDRTMLILDIFAQRARTREGKLQVELAQLRYSQANLMGIGTELSRLGGGIGSRGPGETKLEVDRRRIQARVTYLRKQLKDVQTQRSTRRGDHERDPLVALVGYTNVGKSSLLNRFSRAEGSQRAFVANQPFATLDPTVRRVYLDAERMVRFVDTVGFITDLPKDLLAAFRATLEELQEADVLLHVIDASQSDWRRQRASVEAILDTLELTGKPIILVANKIDAALELDALPADAMPVSAVDGTGIDALRDRIAQLLDRRADQAVHVHEEEV